MRDVRGVGRTVVGFVLAMLAVTLLIQIDPLVPGMDQEPPREIPVAVVGDDPDATTMRDALNGPADHPLAAAVRSSEQLADHQLHERQVSAVLVMGPGGHHELSVTSAANEAEAEQAGKVVAQILAVSNQTASVKDVVPNDPRDPGGIGSFRLAAGWSILGVLFAGLLGLVFGARSPALGLVTLRFGGLAAGALVAGVGGAVLDDLVLRRFDAPFWELAGFGALLVLGVGAVTLALLSWFGAWGLLVATLVIVVLGFPGAIGAWPLTGLDEVWPTMLAWLPPGAGTWAIRGVAYFDGAGVLRVVLMMLGWTIVGYLLCLLAATDHDDDPRLRRFHPRLRRSPVLSAFGGVLMVGVLVALPASPSFTRTDLSPALQVACEPYTRPTTVDQLNDEIESNPGLEGFVGGDIGASTKVAGGRMLFVFGDTIRQPDYGSLQMVRNSMLVFDDDCAGALQRRDRGAVIPDRADGVGYWPMSIASVELDGYNLVGVMTQRVERTGDSPFDFQNLGPSLAVFRVDRDQPPVLQRVADIGEDDPSTARPSWGAAAAVDGTTVYLYGTSRPTDEGFGWALSVARVELVDIGTPAKWRFWDGSTWQRDADRAAVVIPEDNGVSQTLSVFEQDGTWYAISKQADFVGTHLVAWTAPTPQGPFTANPPLAEIPSTDDVLRYDPLAHPDLLPQDGTMVVSVSRNTTTKSDQIATDPSLYRPEFMRVTLP